MEAKGVALVTGASRGIGRAVAVDLARRGFEVVATMRNPDAGAGLPDGVRVERLDVTDLGDFVVPDGLRVLVNNAGLDLPHRSLEHTDMDDWRAVFETNVFGAVAVTRAAIPSLRAAGGGVICSLSSLGILFPMPFYALYRASKAALSAIDESLRAELAPFGVRIVEVLPGPVDTDMLAASGDLVEVTPGDGYEALADWAKAGRDSVAGAAAPTAEAAKTIVDAILDDESPMRIGCDQLSISMIEAWRQQGDEAWMQSLMPKV